MMVKTSVRTGLPGFQSMRQEEAVFFTPPRRDIGASVGVSPSILVQVQPNRIYASSTSCLRSSPGGGSLIVSSLAVVVVAVVDAIAVATASWLWSCPTPH